MCPSLMSGAASPGPWSAQPPAKRREGKEGGLKLTVLGVRMGLEKRAVKELRTVVLYPVLLLTCCGTSVDLSLFLGSVSLTGKQGLDLPFVFPPSSDILRQTLGLL